VELFARALCATETRLDFIINNACQTVRRPAGFYGHLMQAEELALDALPLDTRRLLHGYEAMRGASGGHALAEGTPQVALATLQSDPQGVFEILDTPPAGVTRRFYRARFP